MTKRLLCLVCCVKFGVVHHKGWPATLLPVIDGVAAAVKQVEGLVAQGLKTSKMGSYAMPPRKDYVGQFADDQP